MLSPSLTLDTAEVKIQFITKHKNFLQLLFT